MHDLNTINRLNAEAFAESIHRYRTAGRFVLAKYEGLHLVSIETFSDPVQATAAYMASDSSAGARAVLFYPIGAPSAAVPTRDQSEDRHQPYTLEQLAALGRSTTKSHPDEFTPADTTPADTTLGDYINRLRGRDENGCNRN